MTVEQICQAYGIEVFDYGAGRAGILIGGGSGLMLGTMDVLPIRYCIDADSLDPKSDKIASAILLLARYCAPVFVSGWFTSKSPAQLRAGIAMAEEYGLGERILCYVGGATGFLSASQSVELSEFYDRAQKCFPARSNALVI